MDLLTKEGLEPCRSLPGYDEVPFQGLGELVLYANDARFMY
jgi:hypothetical protein